MHLTYLILYLISAEFIFASAIRFTKGIPYSKRMKLARQCSRTNLKRIPTTECLKYYLCILRFERYTVQEKDCPPGGIFDEIFGECFLPGGVSKKSKCYGYSEKLALERRLKMIEDEKRLKAKMKAVRVPVSPFKQSLRPSINNPQPIKSIDFGRSINSKKFRHFESKKTRSHLSHLSLINNYYPSSLADFSTTAQPVLSTQRFFEIRNVDKNPSGTKSNLSENSDQVPGSLNKDRFRSFARSFVMKPAHHKKIQTSEPKSPAQMPPDDKGLLKAVVYTSPVAKEVKSPAMKSPSNSDQSAKAPLRDSQVLLAGMGTSQRPQSESSTKNNYGMTPENSGRLQEPINLPTDRIETDRYVNTTTPSSERGETLLENGAQVGSEIETTTSKSKTKLKSSISKSPVETGNKSRGMSKEDQFSEYQNGIRNSTERYPQVISLPPESSSRASEQPIEIMPSTLANKKAHGPQLQNPLHRKSTQERSSKKTIDQSENQSINRTSPEGYQTVESDRPYSKSQSDADKPTESNSMTSPTIKKETMKVNTIRTIKNVSELYDTSKKNAEDAAVLNEPLNSVITSSPSPSVPVLEQSTEKSMKGTPSKYGNEIPNQLQNSRADQTVKVTYDPQKPREEYSTSRPKSSISFAHKNEGKEVNGNTVEKSKLHQYRSLAYETIDTEGYGNITTDPVSPRVKPTSFEKTEKPKLRDEISTWATVSETRPISSQGVATSVPYISTTRTHGPQAQLGNAPLVEGGESLQEKNFKDEAALAGKEKTAEGTIEALLRNMAKEDAEMRPQSSQPDPKIINDKSGADFDIKGSASVPYQKGTVTTESTKSINVGGKNTWGVLSDTTTGKPQLGRNINTGNPQASTLTNEGPPSDLIVPKTHFHMPRSFNSFKKEIDNESEEGTSVRPSDKEVSHIRNGTAETVNQSVSEDKAQNSNISSNNTGQNTDTNNDVKNMSSKLVSTTSKPYLLTYSNLVETQDDKPKVLEGGKSMQQTNFADEAALAGKERTAEGTIEALLKSMAKEEAEIKPPSAQSGSNNIIDKSGTDFDIQGTPSVLYQNVTMTTESTKAINRGWTNTSLLPSATSTGKPQLGRNRASENTEASTLKNDQGQPSDSIVPKTRFPMPRSFNSFKKEINTESEAGTSQPLRPLDEGVDHFIKSPADTVNQSGSKGNEDRWSKDQNLNRSRDDDTAGDVKYVISKLVSTTAMPYLWTPRTSGDPQAKWDEFLQQKNFAEEAAVAGKEKSAEGTIDALLKSMAKEDAEIRPPLSQPDSKIINEKSGTDFDIKGRSSALYQNVTMTTKSTKSITVGGTTGGSDTTTGNPQLGIKRGSINPEVSNFQSPEGKGLDQTVPKTRFPMPRSFNSFKKEIISESEEGASVRPLAKEFDNIDNGTAETFKQSLTKAKQDGWGWSKDQNLNRSMKEQSGKTETTSKFASSTSIPNLWTPITPRETQIDKPKVSEGIKSLQQTNFAEEAALAGKEKTAEGTIEALLRNMAKEDAEMRPPPSQPDPKNIKEKSVTDFDVKGRSTTVLNQIVTMTTESTKAVNSEGTNTSQVPSDTTTGKPQFGRNRASENPQASTLKNEDGQPSDLFVPKTRFPMTRSFNSFKKEIDSESEEGTSVRPSDKEVSHIRNGTAETVNQSGSEDKAQNSNLSSNNTGQNTDTNNDVKNNSSKLVSTTSKPYLLTYRNLVETQDDKPKVLEGGKSMQQTNFADEAALAGKEKTAEGTIEALLKSMAKEEAEMKPPSAQSGPKIIINKSGTNFDIQGRSSVPYQNVTMTTESSKAINGGWTNTSLIPSATSTGKPQIGRNRASENTEASTLKNDQGQPSDSIVPKTRFPMPRSFNSFKKEMNTESEGGPSQQQRTLDKGVDHFNKSPAGTVNQTGSKGNEDGWSKDQNLNRSRDDEGRNTETGDVKNMFSKLASTTSILHVWTPTTTGETQVGKPKVSEGVKSLQQTNFAEEAALAEKEKSAEGTIEALLRNMAKEDAEKIPPPSQPDPNNIQEKSSTDYDVKRRSSAVLKQIVTMTTEKAVATNTSQVPSDTTTGKLQLGRNRGSENIQASTLKNEEGQLSDLLVPKTRFPMPRSFNSFKKEIDSESEEGTSVRPSEKIAINIRNGTAGSVSQIGSKGKDQNSNRSRGKNTDTTNGIKNMFPKLASTTREPYLWTPRNPGETQVDKPKVLEGDKSLQQTNFADEAALAGKEKTSEGTIEAFLKSMAKEEAEMRTPPSQPGPKIVIGKAGGDFYISGTATSARTLQMTTESTIIRSSEGTNISRVESGATTTYPGMSGRQVTLLLETSTQQSAKSKHLSSIVPKNGLSMPRSFGSFKKEKSSQSEEDPLEPPIKDKEVDLQGSDVDNRDSNIPDNLRSKNADVPQEKNVKVGRSNGYESTRSKNIEVRNSNEDGRVSKNDEEVRPYEGPNQYKSVKVANEDARQFRIVQDSGFKSEDLVGSKNEDGRPSKNHINSGSMSKDIIGLRNDEDRRLNNEKDEDSKKQDSRPSNKEEYGPLKNEDDIGSKYQRSDPLKTNNNYHRQLKIEKHPELTNDERDRYKNDDNRNSKVEENPGSTNEKNRHTKNYEDRGSKDKYPDRSENFEDRGSNSKDPDGSMKEFDPVSQNTDLDRFENQEDRPRISQKGQGSEQIVPKTRFPMPRSFNSVKKEVISQSEEVRSVRPFAKEFDNIDNGTAKTLNQSLSKAKEDGWSKDQNLNRSRDDEVRNTQATDVYFNNGLADTITQSSPIGKEDGWSKDQYFNRSMKDLGGNTETIHVVNNMFSKFVSTTSVPHLWTATAPGETQVGKPKVSEDDKSLQQTNFAEEAALAGKEKTAEGTIEALLRNMAKEEAEMRPPPSQPDPKNIKEKSVTDFDVNRKSSAVLPQIVTMTTKKAVNVVETNTSQVPSDTTNDKLQLGRNRGSENPQTSTLKNDQGQPSDLLVPKTRFHMPRSYNSFKKEIDSESEEGTSVRPSGKEVDNSRNGTAETFNQSLSKAKEDGWSKDQNLNRSMKGQGGNTETSHVVNNMFSKLWSTTSIPHLWTPRNPAETQAGKPAVSEGDKSLQQTNFAEEAALAGKEKTAEGTIEALLKSMAKEEAEIKPPSAQSGPKNIIDNSGTDVDIQGSSSVLYQKVTMTTESTKAINRGWTNTSQLPTDTDKLQLGRNRGSENPQTSTLKMNEEGQHSDLIVKEPRFPMPRSFNSYKKEMNRESEEGQSLRIRPLDKGVDHFNKSPADTLNQSGSKGNEDRGYKDQNLNRSRDDEGRKTETGDVKRMLLKLVSTTAMPYLWTLRTPGETQAKGDESLEQKKFAEEAALAGKEKSAEGTIEALLKSMAKEDSEMRRPPSQPESKIMNEKSGTDFNVKRRSTTVLNQMVTLTTEKAVNVGGTNTSPVPSDTTTAKSQLGRNRAPKISQTSTLKMNEEGQHSDLIVKEPHFSMPRSFNSFKKEIDSESEEGTSVRPSDKEVVNIRNSEPVNQIGSEGKDQKSSLPRDNTGQNTDTTNDIKNMFPKLASTTFKPYLWTPRHSGETQIDKPKVLEGGKSLQQAKFVDEAALAGKEKTAEGTIEALLKSMAKEDAEMRTLPSQPGPKIIIGKSGGDFDIAAGTATSAPTHEGIMSTESTVSTNAGVTNISHVESGATTGNPKISGSRVKPLLETSTQQTAKSKPLNSIIPRNGFSMARSFGSFKKEKSSQSEEETLEPPIKDKEIDPQQSDEKNRDSNIPDNPWSKTADVPQEKKVKDGRSNGYESTRSKNTDSNFENGRVSKNDEDVRPYEGPHRYKTGKGGVSKNKEDDGVENEDARSSRIVQASGSKSEDIDRSKNENGRPSKNHVNRGAMSKDQGGFRNDDDRRRIDEKDEDSKNKDSGPSNKDEDGPFKNEDDTGSTYKGSDPLKTNNKPRWRIKEDSGSRNEVSDRSYKAGSLGSENKDQHTFIKEEDRLEKNDDPNQFENDTDRRLKIKKEPGSKNAKPDSFKNEQSVKSNNAEDRGSKKDDPERLKNDEDGRLKIKKEPGSKEADLDQSNNEQYRISKNADDRRSKNKNNRRLKNVENSGSKVEEVPEAKIEEKLRSKNIEDPRSNYEVTDGSLKEDDGPSKNDKDRQSKSKGPDRSKNNYHRQLKIEKDPELTNDERDRYKNDDILKSKIEKNSGSTNEENRPTKNYEDRGSKNKDPDRSENFEDRGLKSKDPDGSKKDFEPVSKTTDLDRSENERGLQSMTKDDLESKNEKNGQSKNYEDRGSRKKDPDRSEDFQDRGSKSNDQDGSMKEFEPVSKTTDLDRYENRELRLKIMKDPESINEDTDRSKNVGDRRSNNEDRGSTKNDPNRSMKEFEPVSKNTDLDGSENQEVRLKIKKAPESIHEDRDRSENVRGLQSKIKEDYGSINEDDRGSRKKEPARFKNKEDRLVKSEEDGQWKNAEDHILKNTHSRPSQNEEDRPSKHEDIEETEIGKDRRWKNKNDRRSKDELKGGFKNEDDRFSENEDLVKADKKGLSKDTEDNKSKDEVVDRTKNEDDRRLKNDDKPRSKDELKGGFKYEDDRLSENEDEEDLVLIKSGKNGRSKDTVDGKSKDEGIDRKSKDEVIDRGSENEEDRLPNDDEKVSSRKGESSRFKSKGDGESNKENRETDRRGEKPGRGRDADAGLDKSESAEKEIRSRKGGLKSDPYDKEMSSELRRHKYGKEKYAQHSEEEILKPQARKGISENNPQVTKMTERQKPRNYKDDSASEERLARKKVKLPDGRFMQRSLPEVNKTGIELSTNKSKIEDTTSNKTLSSVDEESDENVFKKSGGTFRSSNTTILKRTLEGSEIVSTPIPVGNTKSDGSSMLVILPKNVILGNKQIGLNVG